MENNRNPKYLVRPNDYHIFEVDNSNGCYRSYLNRNITRSDGTRPNAQSHFTFGVLTNNFDFFPIEESMIEYYTEKNKEYLEYMKWYNRPDGHGGVKGGSIEEFNVLHNIIKEV